MRPSCFQLRRTRIHPRSWALVRGFTLAELLVVVAIIGLLISILVPSLTKARTQSKIMATATLIAGLGTSLDQSKQEARLGAKYPPSTTDMVVPPGTPRDIISNPFKGDTQSEIGHTTGASLLVYALNGADGLGTPGFVDKGLDTDEEWWNDFGAMPDTPPDNGAHALDPNSREPLTPRYGPYADADAQRKTIQSIGNLIEKGSIEPPTTAWAASLGEADYRHLVFTDPFSRPILYYRARSAARAMVPLTTTNPPTPGVYEPLDNVAITGYRPKAGAPIPGLRFKGGPGGNLQNMHPLAKVDGSVLTNADPQKIFADPTDPRYAGLQVTFERYIWDSKVSARPTPVRKDSYLLISAGPDALYGTTDDVNNFGNN